LEHLTLEEEPFLGTFHSLAVSILRQNSELSGRTRYFGILTQNDQIEIIKDCLKVLKIDDKKFDVHQILFELTLCKSYLLTHSFESLEDHLLHQRRLNHDTAAIITALYDRYQTQLRTQNAFDFEDLLVECVRVFETHPHLAQQYSQRYQYLLVDEYQDTNSIQFKLLKHLTSTHDNLCVVGDDDQSIYSWRGADPTHILGFKQSFPKAKVITLSQNYRSHQQILNAAHDVIQHNKKRHAKKLWSSRKEGEILQSVLLEDDAAEAEWVADTLLKHHQDYQLPFHEFAILYRSNPQSRIFEEKLRSRQIPYKIVGTLSFLERKEIKNI
jgi:DNA helicase-2/ATP-dependent DNA helicase PcrA